MITALALSPSLDVTYEVDEIVRGGITRPSAVTRVAGGKALNVARVARRLGAEVRVVAALGGHTGAWIVEALREEGIGVDVVPLDRETRTCAAIVEAAGAASSTDLYERATPLTAEEWTSFAQVARSRAAGTVVLSGSLPAGVDAGDLGDLLGDIAHAGAFVAVDSSGAGLAAAIPHAHLVKVNRAEAGEFFGDTSTAADAALALARRYGIDVVVTDGVDGGHAVIGGEDLALPLPRRVGRFSAGSGDAFLGGLLAALEQGSPAAQALHAAAAAAERNALCAGQGVLAPAL